ncbi:MAG: hypothetical protein GKC04_02825, partial [Methanomicrobiales archaeon]|nr:hypothetical protein [Methanomicrobiales archaeon]
MAPGFACNVPGIDIVRDPAAADRDPSPAAAEGPEPQAGHGPSVAMTTLRGRAQDRFELAGPRSDLVPVAEIAFRRSAHGDDLAVRHGKL